MIMSPTIQAYRRQLGLTLVELMVAITLGLLVISVVFGLFLSTNHSYQQDDQTARMQENGRIALKLIADDLSMAGFWGGMTNTSTITTTLGNQCGIAFGPNTPVAYSLNLTASTANSSYPCIASSDFYAGPTGSSGSNVLVIQRTEGGCVYGSCTPAITGGLVANTVYLLTDSAGSSGKIAKHSGSPVSGANYWPMSVHIYYLRNYFTSAPQKDNIPTLARKILLADGTIGDESTGNNGIADGVEDLNVQFGIDTDNDGVANEYKISPTSSELLNAVTARIYILVRSRDQDATYTDIKKYDIGLGSVLGPFNDHYHRRVFSTTISLRNPANLNRI